MQRLIAFAAVLLVCVALRGTAQTGPKVLLLYDMEGVSAAVRPQDVNFGSDTYAATRASLTDDVNAAIRGLLKAGAREVVLTDGHGSGNPEPDYLIDRLPPGARFEIRSEPYDPYLDAMDDTYDAMVAVAMHGRAGGRAFLAHTYNGHTRWQMGMHDMNESMLVAASFSRFDVPLILVTGDDVLREEIAAFSPDTEYVTVKRANSVEEAEPRPREEVSREIEAAAVRAVGKLKNIAPWRPRELQVGEFENRFGYVLPEQAGVAIAFPGAYSIDNKTIGLRTRSFVEAYQAFRALAGFTGLVGSSLMLRWLRETPGGQETFRTLQQRLPTRTDRTFAATGPKVEALGGLGTHGVR
jgi:D-amino peptidase